MSTGNNAGIRCGGPNARELAIEKDRHEAEVRQAVRHGMSARTGFQKYGVL